MKKISFPCLINKDTEVQRYCAQVMMKPEFEFRPIWAHSPRG